MIDFAQLVEMLPAADEARQTASELSPTEALEQMSRVTLGIRSAMNHRKFSYQIREALAPQVTGALREKGYQVGSVSLADRPGEVESKVSWF